MSPLNNFAAQLAGRRNAQPQSAQSDPNQNWNGYGQPQWNQPPQAQNGGYGQQPNFSQPSFAPAFQPTQDQAQQQPQQHTQTQNGYAPTHDPYAQHRAPAPQAQPQFQQPQGYGQPQAQQPSWQQPDPRGFDVGSYMTPAQAAAAQAASQYRNSPYQQQAEYDQGQPNQGQPNQGHGDWNQGQGQGYQGQGYQGQGYQGQGYQGQDMGFAQAAGGELDPNYGEDQQDYDADDAPRGRRPLMIAAALAGAIFVGGGLAYSYKSLIGGSAGGKPPVVKSAEGPPKAKPADAGGKQFAHTDSKIMGRLGDGNSAPAASGDTDANGTRKVSTLVVGRDGSIQAPAETPAAPAEAPPAPTAASGTPEVPGMMVVDAFANNKPTSAAAAIASAATPPAAAPAAVKPPAPLNVTVAPPPPAPEAVAPAPAKPLKLAKVETPKPAIPAPAQTGSVDQPAAEAPAAPAPIKKPKKETVAAAAPAAAPVAAKSNSVATTGNGANGFVAVLASVPRSDSSRMDALKRFADMQAKYGSVLAGKTPDVAEANLGTKGAYHRLVVGPPGSRDQASNVCTQLKSQGYGDCWVTAY